jgi:hypothetical protein
MHTKKKENNYHQWSVEKGDYERDAEATKTYHKKRKIIKRIKSIVIILIYSIIISIISYFLFAFI